MFSLTKESLRLTDVNPRNEIHGDEKVLAVDLTMEFETSNAVLLKFSPTLRDALYTYTKRLSTEATRLAAAFASSSIIRNRVRSGRLSSATGSCTTFYATASHRSTAIWRKGAR